VQPRPWREPELFLKNFEVLIFLSEFKLRSTLALRSAREIPLPRILKFGGFELLPSTYELRRGSRPVKVERLAMKLLLLLVERHDAVVSREEIAERLWGKDTYVDAENGVNTAIRKVRMALADNPDRPRFIKRVPGKGYRFIAAVAEEQDAKLSSAKRIRLAVLPFSNYAGDPSEDYFCDGMSEETIAALGTVSPQNLGVIARTSAMTYRNTTKSVSVIGKELDVDYVLEGSIRREGNRVRIAVQLIRVDDQTHVWAANYDRDYAGVLSLQTELGHAIAEQVVERIPGGNAPRRQTDNPDAFDFYLRGRFYFAQRSREGVLRAIEFYNHALSLDSSYSLANAGLGDAYATLPINSDYPTSDCRSIGFPAAQRAVAQDSHSAEAYTALAACYFWLTWDWTAAIDAARRAIGLNPSYALAHFYLAHTFSNLCQHDDAEAEIKIVHELDPYSVFYHAVHGQMLYQTGRQSDAAAMARRAITLNPNSWLGHHILGKVLIESGDLDAALTELQQAFELSGGSSEALALKAFALARKGCVDQAKEAVELLHQAARTRYLPPYSLALAYVGLGDVESAFSWLQQAADQEDVRIRFVPVDPRWRELNRDARVRRLWPPPQQHGLRTHG
jgi:TolB-like protein/Flp pilus assembly protein TadD